MGIGYSKEQLQNGTNSNEDEKIVSRLMLDQNDLIVLWVLAHCPQTHPIRSPLVSMERVCVENSGDINIDMPDSYTYFQRWLKLKYRNEKKNK